MKVKYQDKNFRAATLEVIEQANTIIAEYVEDGYDLTLRQLYYQFVARDMLPNDQKSYSRLGDIVNNGRLAGLIDWNAIEDRTRNLDELNYWDDPADIISSAVNWYRLDKNADQPYYIEVWVEKEALAGVFERVCDELEIPSFACRGYVSQSEMWRAANRLIRRAQGRRAKILHFGDHDPSGIDMTRDIRDRLRMFRARRLDVERLALTMEQVEEYSPPPNPAKQTDARFADYAGMYGEESWELDALEPQVLADLVRDRVLELRDWPSWEPIADEQEEQKELLRKLASNWEEAVAFLGEL
jgi:hypothetical protein